MRDESVRRSDVDVSLSFGGALRPRAGVFQRKCFGQPQNQVHVLNGLSGAAFNQIVERSLYAQRFRSALHLPKGEANFGVVAIANRCHFRQAVINVTNERLRRVLTAVKVGELLMVRICGHFDEGRDQNATGQGSGHGHKTQLKVCRSGRS